MEFNIATLFFVEVNISPNPSIVPSLSEIRDLSIITPLPGSLMDTLLSCVFRSDGLVYIYLKQPSSQLICNDACSEVVRRDKYLNAYL